MATNAKDKPKVETADEEASHSRQPPAAAADAGNVRTQGNAANAQSAPSAPATHRPAHLRERRDVVTTFSQPTEAVSTPAQFPQRRDVAAVPQPRTQTEAISRPAQPPHKRDVATDLPPPPTKSETVEKPTQPPQKGDAATAAQRGAAEIAPISSAAQPSQGTGAAPISSPPPAQTAAAEKPTQPLQKADAATVSPQQAAKMEPISSAAQPSQRSGTAPVSPPPSVQTAAAEKPTQSLQKADATPTIPPQTAEPEPTSIATPPSQGTGAAPVSPPPPTQTAAAEKPTQPLHKTDAATVSPQQAAKMEPISSTTQPSEGTGTAPVSPPPPMQTAAAEKPAQSLQEADATPTIPPQTAETEPTSIATPPSQGTGATPVSSPPPTQIAAAEKPTQPLQKADAATVSPQQAAKMEPIRSTAQPSQRSGTAPVSPPPPVQTAAAEKPAQSLQKADATPTIPSQTAETEPTSIATPPSQGTGAAPVSPPPPTQTAAAEKPTQPLQKPDAARVSPQQAAKMEPISSTAQPSEGTGAAAISPRPPTQATDAGKPTQPLQKADAAPVTPQQAAKIEPISSATQPSQGTGATAISPRPPAQVADAGKPTQPLQKADAGTAVPRRPAEVQPISSTIQPSPAAGAATVTPRPPLQAAAASKPTQSLKKVDAVTAVPQRAAEVQPISSTTQPSQGTGLPRPATQTETAGKAAQPTQKAKATAISLPPTQAEANKSSARKTGPKSPAAETVRMSRSLPRAKAAPQEAGTEAKPALSPFVLVAAKERMLTEKVVNEDLSLDEGMEKGIQSVNKIRMKRRQPPPVAPPEPELKMSDVLTLTARHVKIGCFLLVFMVFTGQFISNRVAMYAPRLVSILPYGGKLFPVPNYTDTVSVTVNGPFFDDGDVLYSGFDDPSARIISITVLRVFYDKKFIPMTITTVSESWMDYIVVSNNFPTVENVDRFVIMDLWQNVSRDEYTAMYLRIDTNFDVPFTLKMCYDWYPVDTLWGLLLGSVVLLLLYVMFIWELASNTFTSILCSTLAVAFISMLNPPPTFDDIVGWIDMQLLMLLFSMMIIVDVMSEAGVFDFITVYAYQLSKGHTWDLIQILCIFIAMMSAFMNSSTTMMLASPIIMKLCEVSALNPVRVLTCIVIFANIGAAFTPIGCTANVIITTDKYIIDHGINFGNFMLHMFPCVIMTLFCTYWQLRYYYRDQSALHQSPGDKDAVNRGVKRWTRAKSTVGHVTRDDNIIHNVIKRMTTVMQGGLAEGLTVERAPKTFEMTLRDLKKHHGIRDKVLLAESVFALLFVITIFCVRSVEDLHLIGYTWAALLGAMLLLVLAGDLGDFEAMLSRLDWVTLLFLAGLFVLVEVLSKMGFADVLSTIVQAAIANVSERYQLLVAMMLILWMTALTSCVLNNNPVTTMMLRIVITLSQSKELALPLHPLVWSLVLGACFGGNGSMIAASANIVMAGVAEKHCYKMKFRSYFVIGFTIMLVNVIVASLYLMVAHVLFQWHDMPTGPRKKITHK